MDLDPNKLYAELALFTNIVARVFPGEEVPDWSMVLGRKIIEIPAGVTVQVGDRYNDGQFSPVPAPLTLDEKAVHEIDGLRFLFELNFDQENRIRALEGKAPITKGVYRDALINRWKQLNG